MTMKDPDLSFHHSFVNAAMWTALAIIFFALGLSMSLQWMLLPHRFCLLNDSKYIVPFAALNLIIGIVYFVIPAMMFTIVRSIPWIFFSPKLVYMFGMFILSCGITHVMLVITIWYPAYVAQLTADAVCTFGSVGTLIELTRAKPKLVAFVERIKLLESPGFAAYLAQQKVLDVAPEMV